MGKRKRSGSGEKGGVRGAGRSGGRENFGAADVLYGRSILYDSSNII